MGKRQELIDRLRQVRSILLSTTLGLTEGQLCDRRVTEKWTVKDILGHVAAWEEEFSLVLRKFLKEKNPRFDYAIKEENNWSEWNLSQWEKRKKWSYKKTLENLLAVHEELIEIIERLTDEELSIKKKGSWGKESSIEQIILSQIDHELEHGNQILEWRKKNFK